MQSIKIRQMKQMDLDEVVQIEADTFSCPWSRNAFEDSLKLEYTNYLVVTQNEEVVGYCAYYQAFEEANIVNVAVKETARRQGVARAMLKRLMAEGRKNGITIFVLEVRHSNLPAIRLYESLGFVEAGIRRRFYTEPVEDARIMVCSN